MGAVLLAEVALQGRGDGPKHQSCLMSGLCSAYIMWAPPNAWPVLSPSFGHQGKRAPLSGCAISGPFEDQNVAVSWKQDKRLPPPALPLGPGSLVLIKSLSCCFSSQKHVQ